MRVKCLKCDEVITSKHRRDFRWCSCESVAVDGGDYFFRVIGNQENWEIVEEGCFNGRYTHGIEAD